jgi:DNA-directed RNA polymerase subunit K/omega
LANPKWEDFVLYSLRPFGLKDLCQPVLSIPGIDSKMHVFLTKYWLVNTPARRARVSSARISVIAVYRLVNTSVRRARVNSTRIPVIAIHRGVNITFRRA